MVYFITTYAEFVLNKPIIQYPRREKVFFSTCCSFPMPNFGMWSLKAFWHDLVVCALSERWTICLHNPTSFWLSNDGIFYLIRREAQRFARTKTSIRVGNFSLTLSDKECKPQSTSEGIKWNHFRFTLWFVSRLAFIITNASQATGIPRPLILLVTTLHHSTTYVCFTQVTTTGSRYENMTLFLNGDCRQNQGWINQRDSMW